MKRMTAEEYREWQARSKPLSRGSGLRKNSPEKNFRAKPSYDIGSGRYHASKAEAERWHLLELMERAGEISDLTHQPVVVLVERNGKAKAVKWRLDAQYTMNGRTVIEDVKPRPFTDKEQVMMNLYHHFGEHVLHIMEKKNGTWTVKKSIVPISIRGGK